GSSDGADPRLAPDVLLHAYGAHHRSRVDDAWLVVRPEDQTADVRRPDMTVDLSAGDDRHLGAADEADASTEERNHVLAETQTKRERVRTFQEERPLLGEEERKPREVCAPCVDFGLREIGIHSRGSDHIRPDLLRDVEARLRLSVRTRRGRRDSTTRRDRRAHAEAEPLAECRQLSNHAGAARLRDLVLTRRVGPAIGLEQTLDAPLHVEIPFAQTRLEAEGLRRDQNLDRPSHRRARRAGLPDAVPVRILVVGPGVDQAVIPCAARIDGEDIAGSTVEKGAEDHSNVILIAERSIAAHAEADDPIRIWIGTDDNA